MKELLERLSEPLLRIYSDMQADLLVAIIKRLAADKTLLEDGAFMEWHFRKLNQLNGLTREAVTIISRSTGIAERELIAAIRRAGFESIKDNEDFLKYAHKKGIEVTPPLPPERDPTIINILDSYQRQAKSRLNLVNSTLIDQVGQTYRDIVNRVTADMLAGLKSPQQAMRDMAKQLARKGLTALIDRRGRRWTLEGYVGMIVRTMSNRIANEMQETRFNEWGVDLVEVSSHMGARPLCAPYQGRIYTRTGRGGRYPNLYTDTSYGEPAGLFGINCRHVQYPYFPGLSRRTYKPYPAEENARQYKLEQIQRRYEREVRAAKLEKRLFDQLGDEEGAKRAAELVKARQARLREFVKENGLTRRYDREQIF